MSQLHQQDHEFDVCVIGGGMAGLIAAIASARNGAKTVLIHDRPVFGGNASSEVRMWICGAHGKHNKEAGILEEIQLENQYLNPALNYSIWDSVLYAKAYHQPGLKLLLNCSVMGASMDADDRIGSVDAWQLTSQTMHHVRSKLFIDCSGDSILAALTPAEWRAGREAASEFNEDIEPAEADDKTMGNSLLIQLRRTDETQTFIAPKWAYKFLSPEDFPKRMNGVNGTNFWWIEVGGLQDTIGDAEEIRDELMKVVYGVWDYIKNRAEAKDQAANWAVEWIGSLPGKRENRRYVGDHILTQNDVRAGGQFEDIVAYGGWSMDDHHPAGIYYEGYPTLFHHAPSPYGIPYRSLYSKNVRNLLFAGRNISVTHAALSSTRVMGTTSILGQAAGTAAALAVKHGVTPRDLSSGDLLKELQNALMDDDSWLPGVLRPISALAQSGKLSGGENVEALRDGTDRDRENEAHAWEGKTGDVLEYRWDQPVEIAGARLVFDSNLLNEKRMPCTYPQKGSGSRVPATMVKEFRLEALGEDGAWSTVYQECCNYQRLVRVPLSVKTTGLRLIPEATWGDELVRIFGFEPLDTYVDKLPVMPEGEHFPEARKRLRPEDLAAPDSGLEEKQRGHSA